MHLAEKVCPVIYRCNAGSWEVLAFRHPVAGNQFVKGTIEVGEAPADAARRELKEESGIDAATHFQFLGQQVIGKPPVLWNFFACQLQGLDDSWDFETEDDHGHLFSYFWSPLEAQLDHHWHPIFHEALAAIRRLLPIASA